MDQERTSSIDLQLALSKEILSFNEACVYLNLSAGWLYKLTHSNRIPYYKPNGKKIYFKKEDLIAWLSRNFVKPKEQIKKEAEEYIQANPLRKTKSK